MKTIIFLLLILIFIPTISFADQSVIYNFSSKKIYYSVQNPSQFGKISPFKSKTIYLNGRNAPLNIYRTSTVEIKSCNLSIFEKLDAFVIDKGKSIDCSLRAERLPKEF